MKKVVINFVLMGLTLKTTQFYLLCAKNAQTLIKYAKNTPVFI
jgi:hypothetical protein